MEKKAVTSPVAKVPMAPPKAAYPVTTAPEVKPMEKHEMKKWCHDHMYRYVLVQTKDGWCCDGFIEHIDDEMVCIAIPLCEPAWDHRAFFPTPFFTPFVPAPFFPRRRFFRQVIPLAVLLALTLLPFF